ncbi:fungal-specific transcription factor domain-containing protein [Desarmillaria ectypa]|nr:fungal-specific transcription factor domain-containing protein [Desarmillaria ectypa]
MSRNAEEHTKPKKRGLQRACEICRHKKIRCDGMQMPGNRCSNCLMAKLSCTYSDRFDSAAKYYSMAYVKELENKVQRMEKLLHDMIPEVRNNADNRTKRLSSHSYIEESESVQKLLDELETEYLAERDRLSLEENAEKCQRYTLGYRFFGKSSDAQLTQAAINLKQEYSGQCQATQLPSQRPEFWEPDPWNDSAGQPTDTHPKYTFPEEDLLRSLLDLYFDHINVLVPLLHRPTLEKLIEKRAHFKDAKFADALLLICAIASGYSDDPRVLLEGERSRHSSGWKWANQVVHTHKPLMRSPSLYNLQSLCLWAEFIYGSSLPLAWTVAGVGLRLAMDVGAHRRRANEGPICADTELWKRAFWSLLIIDRMTSSMLGRPCALYDEEIDIDLPIECDDQYWEHSNPERAFKQRAGEPSLLSHFNCCLRLGGLLLLCLRTIYCTKRPKLFTKSFDTNWEERVVENLNVLLQKWVDLIPEHLVWDPDCANILHFSQSANLYIWYYYLLMLIHRPFIVSPRGRFGIDSLAACVRAARNCACVIDVQRRRLGPCPAASVPGFDAGIILLFNIYHQPHSHDHREDMDDVNKCLQVLRILELRWQIAGVLRDILHGLESTDENRTAWSMADETRRPSPVPGLPSSVEVSWSELLQPLFAGQLFDRGTRAPCLGAEDASYVAPRPTIHYENGDIRWNTDVGDEVRGHEAEDSTAALLDI